MIIGLAMVSCSTSDNDSQPSAESAAASARELQGALDDLVAATEGPPGVLALIGIADDSHTYTAGTGTVGAQKPITDDDITRIASVSKAFSGAVAMTLVRDGELRLDSTIGEAVTGMPASWADVTLAQLLHHTGGIPDYIKSSEFLEKLTEDPTQSWEPRQLVAFVADEPLEFTPGSEYRYSDTDNILVGLMVEQATGGPYSAALQRTVYEPLGLGDTSLATTLALPDPHIQGYDHSEAGEPEDVSEVMNPTGAWASGGMLSTAEDLDEFVRAYVSGELVGTAQRDAQFDFVPGGGGPPGPGQNEAGLAIYRYTTDCGVVYGHTGNFPGYTTFIAATEDGTRSAVVLTNSQINDQQPEVFSRLTAVFDAAVCALEE